MIKRVSIFILTLLIIFSGCENDITKIKGEFDQPSKAELEKLLSIEGVDYDSLVIKNNENANLDGDYIRRIELQQGLIASGQFEAEETISVYYDSETKELEFSCLQKIEDNSLREVFYTCRFFFMDSSFSDVYLRYFTYKYPYKSVEIYKTTDEIFSEHEVNLQDIDFNEGGVFFHPAGPLGIYRYDKNTHNAQLLYEYPSGDCIAHESDYVFFDYAHKKVFRYNLETGTQDLEIDLSNKNFQDIDGMDCYQNELYILFNSPSGNYIAKYSLDGEYLTSIPINKGTHFMAIDSGILYTHNYADTLYRFDLNAGEFLESRKLPAYQAEGIRIADGKFFFVDWYKKMIGIMPLSELQ